MITLQRTVWVNRPREAVYDYLADFANSAEWDAGTVSCERVSGDGSVGSVYVNVSRFLGRRTTLRYTLTALEPAAIVLRGENKTLASTDTITIGSTEDSTQVDYTAQFRIKAAARLIEPLLWFPLQRLADRATVTLETALKKL